jgi:hypothetical protein
VPKREKDKPLPLRNRMHAFDCMQSNALYAMWLALSTGYFIAAIQG